MAETWLETRDFVELVNKPKHNFPIQNPWQSWHAMRESQMNDSFMFQKRTLNLKNTLGFEKNILNHCLYLKNDPKNYNAKKIKKILQK